MVSKSEILKKAGVAVISILLSLFIAELALRQALPQQDKLYVWQPNLSHTFYPDSTVFCGVSGAKHFTINAQGFRGDEFTDKDAKKYLCIGGSTTECLYLDDNETWMAQTQNLLNTEHAMRAAIGSIGKSGCTTRENYIQLKYYVPQLGKIDGVILMVGLNDLMKRLSSDTLFNSNFIFNKAVEDSMVNTIFLSTAKQKSWWRKTALFTVLQNVLHKANKVQWQNIQDDKGEVYTTWRANRKHAPVSIDSLPDLTAALNEYERNLQLIYNESQKQGLQLVLVTQSALYKDTLSAFENSLLWMGGKGNFQQLEGCGYYSPRCLAQALQLYNQRMQLFCAGKPGIKLIDLASQLPRDTSVFYDDCHFNQSGAKKVAGIISAQLFR